MTAPDSPDLAAEQWIRLGQDNEPIEYFWVHAPSQRSIKVSNVRQHGEDEGWSIVVCKHDELGNPLNQMCSFLRCDGNCSECRAACQVLGPYPLLAEAFRVARGIRKSILEDRPDVQWAEQIEMFGDEKDGGR